MIRQRLPHHRGYECFQRRMQCNGCNVILTFKTRAVSTRRFRTTDASNMQVDVPTAIPESVKTLLRLVTFVEILVSLRNPAGLKPTSGIFQASSSMVVLSGPGPLHALRSRLFSHYPSLQTRITPRNVSFRSAIAVLYHHGRQTCSDG